MSDSSPRNPVGFWIGFALICALYATGALHHGFARPDAWRGVAVALVAALGCAGLWMWRWPAASEGVQPPGHRFAVFLGALVCVVGLWNLPLPAGVVAKLSPVWAVTLDSLAEAGIERPGFIPLTQSPEDGMAALGVLFCAVVFFMAAVPLCRSRRYSNVLMWLVAGASVFTGIVGLLGWLINGYSRASAVLYNPTHYAVFVLSGLPLWFMLVARSERDESRSMLERASNPRVLLYVIGFIAALGWLVSFSRASLLIGAPMMLIFAIGELIIARNREAGGSGRTAIAAGAVAVAVLLASAIVFDGFQSRLAQSDVLSANSRMAFWEAEWAAFAESHYLGIGPGSSRYAINRFSPIPLDRMPIHAHNDPLEWLVELGLPATILLSALLIWFFLAWVPWLIRAGVLRARGRLLRGLLWGIVLVLALSVYDFHLRVPLMGFQFLLMMALSLGQGTYKIGANSSRKLEVKS